MLNPRRFLVEALTALGLIVAPFMLPHLGFSLTTMRYFQPYDITRCPNVVTYLARIGARPAYRRAMEKGDPGMALLLT